MICKLCGTSYTSTECTLCGLKPHEYANVTSLDFGKYKGLAIEQVFYRDPGYLRWMIRQGAGTPVQRAKARLLFIGTSRNDVNDLILAKRQLTRRQAGREEAQTSVYPSQTNDSQNYPIIWRLDKPL